MSQADVKHQLEALLDLLHRERDMAKALDMEGLQATVSEKEALLANLNPCREDVEELQDLLRQVDHENRRNAFLLWTGLNWVRDMMGFFGKAAMPQVYGGAGQSQTLTQGGRLLSGKV